MRIGRGFLTSAYPYFFRERRNTLKKTECLTKAHRLNRLIVLLVVIFIVCCCITTMVFAAPATTLTTSQEDAEASILAMNVKIYRIYRLIRNNVAFPLLAISFASCGFKILGASILGTGKGSDRGIQAAKEQIFVSISALLLIIVLPYLISYGIDLFKSNAWTPPGVILIMTKQLGGIWL